MRVRVLAMVAVLLMVGVAAAAAMRTAAFRVDGMNTDEEVRRVTASLERTPGVSESAGDPRSQMVMVRYDDARTRMADLAEAVDMAGFSLSPLEARDHSDREMGRMAAVLGDFNAVLSQTRQAMERDRYGLVRNLALAMKVRKDAVVALAARPAPPRGRDRDRGRPGYPPPPPPPDTALAKRLSQAVDDFAAAADARDRGRAEALFPQVKQAFRRLVDACDLDGLMAAPPYGAPQGYGQSRQDRSLMEQLKDLAGKYF